MVLGIREVRKRFNRAREPHRICKERRI